MMFFFKQKTAYEMRISDWSSDVCSSDLHAAGAARAQAAVITLDDTGKAHLCVEGLRAMAPGIKVLVRVRDIAQGDRLQALGADAVVPETLEASLQLAAATLRETGIDRSEEHTSELQSLMRISYAVFCLKQKTSSQRSKT